MLYARQSTAIIVTVGPVLDADGVAVTTAVVGNFKLSKNGGAPAALDASATLTHRHTGKYSLSLTATDVNTVGSAEVTIDATTNECPLKELQVIEPAVYDALFADTAAGYQVPIWSSAGATVNLSATTIATLTNLPAITANWLTASGLATDAVEEIRNAITGGAYDLDTDANGRIRIVDGVGAGEINTNAGAIALVDLVTTLTTYTGNTPQTGDSYAVVNSGTFGNSALKTLIDAVDNFVDTEITDIQNRLPAALVSGRMDASVGAMAANVLTAAATAADFGAEVADAVWDEAISGHLTSGTTGRYLSDAYLGTVTKTGASVNDAGASTTSFATTLTEADDFWNDALLIFTSGALAGQSRSIFDYANTNGQITLDEALTSAPANGVTFIIKAEHIHPVSQIADAIWDEDATGHQTQGTFGQAIGDPAADSDSIWALVNTNLNATVSSRASQTSVDTIDDFLDTEVAAILAAVDTEVAALVSELAKVPKSDSAVTWNATALASIQTEATDALTTALTEGYRSHGATGSAAQLLYEILAATTNFSIASTTKTAKKIDGSTTAKTYTLDSATTPTSVVHAS